MTKRPAVIPPGMNWYSVQCIHESTGVRDVELAWCGLHKDVDAAALAFYNETDQCGRCRVRFQRESENIVMRFDATIEPTVRVTTKLGGGA